MDTSHIPKATFLMSLEELAAEPVPHQQIVQAFTSIGDAENFTAAEFKKLVDFSVFQLALWRVRWHFSSADAPDTAAEGEDAGWQRLWDVFSSALAEKVPDVAEPLRQVKDLSVGQALIQRKLEHDGMSILRKWWAAGAGGLAIALKRIGFRGIAQELYKRALYPRGTVGRNL
jgi:hypothetical protein